MINKILIANRGEIACRIIRTAARLNIKTVAVYSEVDANALHVQMADEAICLGEAAASKSYLNTALIIEKAIQYNVDAIHPGYGFLSENAEFAQVCQQNNITFIGPSSEAIKAMGSKSAAKTIMEAANVPLVPGYHGNEQDPDFLHKQAQAMGYPVLLKAAAGGGGKGMRQVWSDEEFHSALISAKRESLNSFGDDHMLVEKYLTQPRHIEIQIFCDNHGNGVYLFERDCSIQRRHQKVIEEAPAPNFPSNVRTAMGEAALKAAHAINYTGAGTVEFLYDTDGSFYFMEMNTRLQVEHPVTEFITQEDLVEWQIIVANGLPLPKSQTQLSISGHAFEARIYAEDPNNEFLPSTGKIEHLITPKISPFVRVDTGIQTGDEVSIFYDPMVAKLIVWGEDRNKALSLLINSLQQFMLCGITSNIDYLIKLAQSEPFVNAELSTDYIERHNKLINLEKAPLLPEQQIAILGIISAQNISETNELSGYRVNHVVNKAYEYTYNQETFSFEVQQLAPCLFQTKVSKVSYTFEVEKHDSHITIITPDSKLTYAYYENNKCIYLQLQSGMVCIEKASIDFGTADESASAGDVVAPMNGNVVKVMVSQNEKVKKDQVLIIIEAMKMEHSLKAPFSGVVKECRVNAGDTVEGNELLLTLLANEQ